MQNVLKTISILLFVALGSLAFSSGTKANLYAENSVAKNADVIAPNDLYVRNCARCHGADGAGETELGRKLDVPDLTINGKKMSSKKISRVITNGEDEMPAFGKKLSKKQIASLTAYVRKL